ncbi:hypothetical protein AC478_01630 [miscellaneous Crenarchaeota group-1 archaeon SG8-32-3]|uniref:Uncharacterized protein n=1 Tax=miscellaneous Crenarchaeota group-1 archaeon SG8-32-3 TaxID=1685125 RepID=A0A0M0BTQ4_9ARCH|nr:MAG: hypothetical protein AC478_01630 [miscellaneous Crenarchaeota group-1 archaeon SG8-32-3]
MIFETSAEVSVFQVAGSPQVINKISDANLVSTNSLKGSLILTPLTVKFRQNTIKPFWKEEQRSLLIQKRVITGLK